MTIPQESLGAAERIVKNTLTYVDHCYHNRTGAVLPDPTSAVGVRWIPAKLVREGAEGSANAASQILVFELHKGKKPTRVGVLDVDRKRIIEGGRQVAEYRPAGLFPEVVTWMYRQIAEIWKLDNELCARWASYAFAGDHADLKVLLAAFMLVQSRRGDTICDDGKIARLPDGRPMLDEDYRAVGEAMCLCMPKDGYLNVKHLLRVREVLALPAVAEINRELGFGQSAREAFLGRWKEAVTQWLTYREANPEILQGLVRAAWKSSVRNLARLAQYRAASAAFYKTLGWAQDQSKGGHRKFAIGEVIDVESWEGLNERQICERIGRDRPSFKQVVSLVPTAIGLTPAIVAASIEAGALSDKDLIIALPTIERYGLLDVPEIRARVERAATKAKDLRAANQTARLRTVEGKALAEKATDAALAKAVVEEMRGIELYVMVDVSSSMDKAIDRAKDLLKRMLPAFPLDQLHVVIFNTTGRSVTIEAQSAAAVEKAFRGIGAGGGTDYGAGVFAAAKVAPKANNDAVFVFVGDEEHANGSGGDFLSAMQAISFRPMAFGLLRVIGPSSAGRGDSVRRTASALNIPCGIFDERSITDTYAGPRALRAFLASTPVAAPQAPSVLQQVRKTLIAQIAETALLEKPDWALAGAVSNKKRAVK